jgi:hypothetical protein
MIVPRPLAEEIAGVLLRANALKGADAELRG